MARFQANGHCLAPGCPVLFGKNSKHQMKRGLCQKHYMQAYLAIKRCETTWEELEALGLAITGLRDGSIMHAVLAARRDFKQAVKA